MFTFFYNEYEFRFDLFAPVSSIAHNTNFTTNSLSDKWSKSQDIAEFRSVETDRSLPQRGAFDLIWNLALGFHISFSFPLA